MTKLKKAVERKRANAIKEPPSEMLEGLNWEQRAAALEDAFRGLAIKSPHATSGIPYVRVIPGIGRQLLLMTPVPRRVRPSSAKAPLTKLEKACGRLVAALDVLPRDAIEVIGAAAPAFERLEIDLRIVQKALKGARYHSGPGAPKKIQPSVISETVGFHYYCLTGKKPTVPKKEGKAYGPFLNLLKVVFAILQIGNRASAVSQAEKVSRNWASIAAKMGLPSME